MFTHITVGANDVEASRKFYDAALGALGHEPGSFDEPLDEQAPGRGRVPSPKKRYARAAAVIAKETKRLNQRQR